MQAQRKSCYSKVKGAVVCVWSRGSKASFAQRKVCREFPASCTRWNLVVVLVKAPVTHSWSWIEMTALVWELQLFQTLHRNGNLVHLF